MKVFKLKADIEFKAMDILDACNKLSLHFQKVANMVNSDLILGGEIELEIMDNPDASIDLTGKNMGFIVGNEIF